MPSSTLHALSHPAPAWPVTALGTLREAVVDAALARAERDGWDAVRLHDLAQDLGVPLAALRREVEHKDDIAEAFFDRADAAMLAVAERPGAVSRAPRERVRQALLAWFDALAPHRTVAAAMLRYKLHPEHLHLQALGVMRISRTVQWLREAAALPAVGWRRELEEAVLTAIYLATFARWLADTTPSATESRRLLDRLLALAGRSTLRGSL